MRTNGLINEWLCENCQLVDASGSFPPEPSKESTKGESQLIITIRSVMTEMIGPLRSEIFQLKNLIRSQNKQILSLVEDIKLLKTNKNTLTKMKTAERNSLDKIKIPSHLSGGSLPEIRSADGVSTLAPVPDDSLSGERSTTDEVATLDPGPSGDVSDSGAVSGVSVLADSGPHEWSVIVGRGNKSNKSKRRSKAEVSRVEKNPRNNRPIIGSSASNALTSVPKKQLSYIHVSRLSPATSIADLKKFLNNRIPNLVCEKLNSKQPEVYSSFKLSFPSEFQSQLLDPAFWPEGITINKFFRKPHGTATRAKQ